ncbi:MAG: exosortase/archaeosortase family protein [Planctomycetaceae bacterium]
MPKRKKPPKPPQQVSQRVEPRGLQSLLAQHALPALALGLVCLYAYWPAFVVMWDAWTQKPEYQHGFLIPAFAAGLLWLRREQLDVQNLRTSWWGVPFVLLAVVVRQIGAHYYYESLDLYSLLPCVFGIVLLTGGWAAIRWAWPAIGFLVFMIPMPHFLETGLRGPLRTIGTVASTYLMQTIGLPAISQGHVIIVNDSRIGVDEACSGLAMLMTFVALSAAVALLIRRPLWERTVVLLSAVPIALIANVVRVASTGLMHVWLAGTTIRLAVGDWVLIDKTGTQFTDEFFHNWAGYLMPLLGLVLLAIELRFLARLIIVEEDRPLSVALAAPPLDAPAGEVRTKVAASR